MAKLTNAQLAADNAALRAQLDTQHIINRQLISDMATARALIAAAQPSPNLIHQTPANVKPRYEMPAWQVARSVAMAEAKNHAMATGTHVKVQS